MSAAGAVGGDARGLSPSALSSPMFMVAALVAITVFSLVYQQRWGTIADTSWLITVCERMLAGERLYVDVFETNPPFSVWLYMPPVALAKTLGIAPEILVHGWTYLAVVTGLLFTGLVVRRAGLAGMPALPVCAPVVYALLVIMPGNAFSQREHIGMALFLPLLALIAWRAKGGGQPGTGMAILAGLGGSVLLLVKPYYALMVLLPVIFAMSRRRSLRPLLAPEMWTIGVVCAAYPLLVLMLHPEFFSDVYPVVAETYARINYLGKLLRVFALPYAMLVAFVWFVSRWRGMSELATVFTLASLGGIVCLVWQGKGFAYHAWPAFLCAAVALCCLLARPEGEGKRGRTRRMRDGVLLLAALPVIGFAATPFRPAWGTETALVEPVRAAIRNPTVAQIGTDLAIGHPFTRLINGRWVSAYASDWQGSAALILRERAADGEETARLSAIAGDYVAGKRAELGRLRPDILLVQTNDVLWRGIMADPQRLAPLLEDYRVIAEGRRVRVLLRKDAVNPP